MLLFFLLPFFFSEICSVVGKTIHTAVRGIGFSLWLNFCAPFGNKMSCSVGSGQVINLSLAG